MAAATSKGSRKRHVQQVLFRHGGKRKGAGRKPKGARASEAHKVRPEVKAKHALHVVLRVVPAVGNMRRRDMSKAIRSASIVAAVRERIRIIHISIQQTHVHMLVEAASNGLLARGLQGFQISAARNINTALGADGRRRKGRVFVDRYHLVVIKSPTQARHALAYVLGNWRKHGEDRSGPARGWLLDPYATGRSFPDWKELELELEHERDSVMRRMPTDDEPLVVQTPKSWLLSVGWKLAGDVSAREIPSRRRGA